MVASDLALDLDVPQGSLALGVGEAVVPVRGVGRKVDLDFVEAVFGGHSLRGTGDGLPLALVGAAIPARAAPMVALHRHNFFAWGYSYLRLKL